MLGGLVISFSWQDLWFLRPQWFWGFIPVATIALMFLVSFRRKEEWKRSFSKALLPFITIKGTRSHLLLPRLFLILLLGLMIVGLAGPTWEEREQPGNRTEAALVIVLDLSRSMLAEDIQPNRLERARLKLKDLFDAQPGIRTALVAYAGSAHTVVPFTKDYPVISSQMEALRPGIMPMMGTNLDDALDLADSLLQRIEAPSSILLVTDGVGPGDLERIRESTGRSRVEVMIMGTPGGATIPWGRGVVRDRSGKPVVAGFDPSLLMELGNAPQVNIVTVTLDESDVKILAMHIRENLEFIADPEEAETAWKDAGYWLLIPAMLLSLLWFRRGWMVHWIWLLFIIPGCSDGNDFSMADLFRSPDQQGQQLYEKGEVKEAAERFESAHRKGYAWAEAGELGKAAEAYSRETNAEGFYNLGVLYARMGDVEAARGAFAAALEMDPELEVARENLERVDVVLDSLFLAGERKRGAPKDEKPKPDKFEEPGKISEDQEQAQDSDEKFKGKGDLQEMGSKEVDESTIDFFDTGGEPAPFDQQGARQSLLRQVDTDPSIFLRRKFAHQLRNRKQKPERSEQTW
ncbi:MAG: VWA domain-containing protein [Bacteroidota bacterium]